MNVESFYDYSRLFRPYMLILFHDDGRPHNFVRLGQFTSVISTNGGFGGGTLCLNSTLDEGFDFGII